MAADTRARAQKLLAEARSAVDLPALAAGDAVLMPSTALSNTFICQPQQQNMHGRVFGGFLMRCSRHSHPQSTVHHQCKKQNWSVLGAGIDGRNMRASRQCIARCRFLSYEPNDGQQCPRAMRRRAFELAFSTTYMFAGSRPEFLLIDEVTFQHPVDIGDLLRFRSAVVHTQQPVAPSNKVLRRALDSSNPSG